MGNEAARTDSSTHGHHCSREILEASAFCTRMSSAIAHGKSWNCCSLEIVPDRENTGDTGNHTLESNLPYLVTKSWTQALASEGEKKRSVQITLSGNVKLTRDKKGFWCPEKKPLDWIISN